MPTKTRATTPKTTTPKANPSSRPSSSPGSSSSAPSGGGIDELSYMVHKNALDSEWRGLDLQVRQTKVERKRHELRGEEFKTEAKSIWADTQGIKVERQQVQQGTEQIKLQTDVVRNGMAQDKLQYTQAKRVLNQAGYMKDLSKQQFGVTGNPSFLDGMRQAMGSASSVPAIGASSAPKADFAKSRKKESA